MVESVLLGLRQLGELSALVGSSLRLFVHLLDKVVGVNHGALAGLHLALGEFDHAVGEVVYLVRPAESELGEYELQHLEVVVLLVADHVDMGVEAVFLEPLLGRAEVLGDIDRGAVGTQQQLAVEAVGGEVAPHGAVGVALEHAHVEAALHQFLAEQIGVVLIVCLVERNAERLVGLLEAVEHP